ncbi:MAG: DUF5117 domain-containing protein, partial [Rhodothermaceae bacterium]|nr:DUF5117 domain-containing protein [Rhodothermaceae bacterium]
MKPFHSVLAALLTLFLIAGCASSRQAAPPAAEAPTESRSSDDDDSKKYSDVITEDAETDDGLFKVHQIEDKLYFEIPDSLLGAEMLLVTRTAATMNNLGYGGMKTSTQVLRWEKQDKKIMLRIVSFENVADEDEPIYNAVRNSNFEPILRAFDIETLNDDSTATVVEVTDLFTSDVPSLGLPSFRREMYRVRRLDPDRTYISSANSYPLNIEVKHVLSYDAAQPPSNASAGTITVEMNQSMILLPTDPMQPRLCDQRVGFFSVTMTDYGRDAQKAEERCYITRWRLEPKDPEAYARGELTEPIKPIVYYIDPATPMKWRPYLK